MRTSCARAAASASDATSRRKRKGMEKRIGGKAGTLARNGGRVKRQPASASIFASEPRLARKFYAPQPPQPPNDPKLSDRRGGGGEKRSAAGGRAGVRRGT